MRYYRLGQLVGLLFGACLLVGAAPPAVTSSGAKTAPATTATATVTPPVKVLPIEVVPSDGFNLAVDDQINPHYVVVKLTSPVHNHFGGQFINIPTDSPTTIGLNMNDNDASINKADVTKWQGLKPLYSYADLSKLDSLTTYTRDSKNRWVSSDIFKTGDAKFAGSGKTPKQNVIPEKIAEQFLIKGKNGEESWEAFREIDNAEAVKELNIFRFRQLYDLPSVSCVMRIPFTYTVLQQLIEKLKAAKLPGVTVDELGLTPEKRKLQIIRVTDPTSKLPEEQRFGNLFIAREHSSENASSIMLLGALNSLLQPGAEAQALRKDTTWSFILIEDPDGSASVQFDRLTDQFADFQSPTWPPEVLLWTSGLSEQYYAGKLMDVVVSLHNIEANESPSNLFCPFIDSRFTATVEGINTLFFTRVKAQGMQTGEANKPWATGVMNSRLFGWCSRQYGSLPLNYEVNDRYPANRLTLKKTMDIGAAMVQALRAWEITPDGQKWHKDRQAIRQRRIAARDGYYTKVGHSKDLRTAKDILNKGF